MPVTKSASIKKHFADLSDPRQREGTYPLINIVVIAICAVTRTQSCEISYTKN